MLQWMGGSRRKVSTSRKSTQSRQKQYFEQRRRRNQSSGLENYGDGRNKCVPQHEEPRSLDILSLINVATVAPECEPIHDAVIEECRSGCSNSGENPKVDKPQVHSLKHSLAHCDATNKVSLEDFSDLNEAKLSVLDMLDDNNFHAISEERSEPEAHVAFSVRGLGKMGTETPVHSPMETNRVFFDGFHSPPKAAKKLHCSMNFKYATDDLEADLNKIMHGAEKSPPSPFISRADTDCFGYLRSMKFIDRSFMAFDATDCSSNNFANEEETFCSGLNEKNELTYNAKLGFLDDKFLDERKFNISEMIQPLQLEYDTSNSLRAANYEICNYGFEDPCMLNKRVRENTRKKYNTPEFPKQFPSGKENETIVLDDERHAPLIHSWGLKSMWEQSSQPCLDKVDTMDTLSLLSEESCSSGAVRGKHTKKSALQFVKLKASKRSHSIGHWKSPEKNVSSQQIKKMMHANLDEVHHEKNLKGVREHKDVLNLLISKTNSFFEESPEVQRIIEPWRKFSFGEGFTPVHEELYLNKESCSVHKFVPLLDHPSSAGWLFDKDVLQPACSSQSNDSQSFSSISSECMKPDVRLVSRVEGQHPYSSCVFDLEKDDEVHNVSTRDVGDKDKDELTFVTTNCRQALKEQPKGVSIGSSDLSSGNGKSADFIDFKDSCSEHGEANDENLESVESSKARNSPEHGEKTPSAAIENPTKLEECIKIQQNGNDTAILVSAQHGKKELGDDVSDDRNEQHCSNNLSYQVMLENYVLQLLCVQKVLKEASEPKNAKK